MKALMSCGVAALLLAGCLNSGGTEGEGDDLSGITLQVTDTSGALFGADSVYWSYHPDPEISMIPKQAQGNDTAVLGGAVRLNAMGTRWKIQDAGLHGTVYVRAFKTLVDSTHIALCNYFGYSQTPVNADTLPKDLTIVLSMRKICL